MINTFITGEINISVGIFISFQHPVPCQSFHIPHLTLWIDKKLMNDQQFFHEITDFNNLMFNIN